MLVQSRSSRGRRVEGAAGVLDRAQLVPLRAQVLPGGFRSHTCAIGSHAWGVRGAAVRGSPFTCTETAVSRTITFLALLSAVPAFAVTGREVIDTAQQRHGFSTWHDRTSSATMDNYEKNTLTRTRELEISEQTDPRGSQRSLTAFAAPADVKGTLFLHLSPRGERDEQWIWTPSTQRARRLAEAKQDENFFGSDLTYRDLELLVRIQQWNDQEARATLVGEEDLDGKRCYVVELVPRNTEYPYAKYRLWFGTADFLLWRLDVYDTDETVVKRVSAQRHERIQDYTTLTEIVVANVPAETHTVFRMHDVHYDQGIPDDLFRVATFSRGR